MLGEVMEASQSFGGQAWYQELLQDNYSTVSIKSEASPFPRKDSLSPYLGLFNGRRGIDRRECVSLSKYNDKMEEDKHRSAPLTFPTVQDSILHPPGISKSYLSYRRRTNLSSGGLHLSKPSPRLILIM